MNVERRKIKMIRKLNLIKWIGIALSLFVVLGLMVPNPATAAKKNIIIGGLSWSGSTAIEHIIKYVLE